MTSARALRLHRSGDIVLVGAFGAGVLLLLMLVSKAAAPTLYFIVPGMAFGALVAAYVASRPRLNFSLVLALSVFTIGFKAGIQVEEVLYGLYFLSYLIGWFGLRLLVYREPLTAYAGDRAMLLFLIGIVASTAWSFAFGATLDDYIGGASALAFLAFYFPVREACMRWDNGVKLVVVLFFWIGLYVAVRNLLMYQELIAEAVLAAYIRNRRVSMNDNVLMAGSVVAMALLSVATRWRYRLVLAGGLVLLLIALVLTFSRAQWVVVLFGFGLTVLLGRGRQRLHALAWITGGFTVVTALLFLVAGDKVAAVLEGLVSRFATLSSATRSDISLISRFYEAQAALERIRVNPVLGYGVGVPFEFFDIISQTTLKRTLIHNGYVSLWYRFGLWGPILLGTAWLGAIWRGLKLWRLDEAPLLERAVGFGCALALICYFISTITANPFHNSDGLFIFALLSGMAAGTHARVELRNSGFPPRAGAALTA